MPLPVRRRSTLHTVDLSIDDDDVEVFDSDSSELRPRPSRLRRFLVGSFVFLVFVAIALLVMTELAIIFERPWLDPRPHLLKAFRFVQALVAAYARG